MRIDGDYIENIIFPMLINITHLHKRNESPSLCWSIRPLPPPCETSSSAAVFSTSVGQ